MTVEQELEEQEEEEELEPMEELNTKEEDQEELEADVEVLRPLPPPHVVPTPPQTTTVPLPGPASEVTPALDQQTPAMELQEATLEDPLEELLVDMEVEDVMPETLTCLTPSLLTLQKL